MERAGGGGGLGRGKARGSERLSEMNNVPVLEQHKPWGSKGQR